MRNKPANQNQLSNFMLYLASLPQNDKVRLPALSELSQILKVSIASLREQMEVARAMGLIEVHPRTGIQKLPFTFTHTVLTGLNYAIEVDQDKFNQFADLRKHIEASYWKQAISLLQEEDFIHLKKLCQRATVKLNSRPPQIPHNEHKDLHLSLYRRLNNPFVYGLLEAYWLAYEETGLAVYTDLNYLERVWNYHQQMVDAISLGDMDKGYAVYLDHMELMSLRSPQKIRHRFE